MLEFFCAILSRRSTHPVLLVRSDLNPPIWISPHESLKLAVGECDFTCCETNHLGHRGDSKLECSRPSVRRILDRMIEAKVKYLFTNKMMLHGRALLMLKHWWLRGLVNAKEVSEWSRKDDFKKYLKWNDVVDGAFFDRLANGPGLTALHYAARRGDVEIVTLLLEAGADPYIENEMGLNSFDISEKFGPFPSVRKVLKEYNTDNSR